MNAKSSVSGALLMIDVVAVVRKQSLLSGVMKKQVWFGALLYLALSGSVFSQSTGTISGRLVDATGATVAGAAVTVTSTTTGVTRETVTNGEGLYSIPALQPGVYDIKVEMTGFAPSSKKGVTLVTDTTLAEDFSLAVAGTTQQVEVSGEAVMVETTQSEVSGTLQTSEVQNLPMLNRNFVGLVTLVPGARPAPLNNPTKYAMGSSSISFGGSGGRNVMVSVDGADNRDDVIGGPLQNYTLEGVQEFKLLSHQFGAQYGRSSGAVLQIVSKSGTNQLHGSVFGYGRNDAMTAIDYFTQQQSLPKTSYSREQYGGSIGGPIKKDRWFFFGAFERTQQSFVLTVNPTSYKQALIFASALPSVTIIPAATIPEPFHDNMYTLKTDFQITRHHSLFVRWAHQINSAPNDQFTNGTTKADLSIPTFDDNNIRSLVVSETWVIGSNSVNQFLYQYGFYDDNVRFDHLAPITGTLTFPSLAVGQGPSSQDFHQKKYQFKDDFSHQMGKHALKFGGDFSFYPELGLITDISYYGGISFFDDPSTIVNNTNGKYPKGFLTPGIVSSISLGTVAAGGPYADSRTLGGKQVGAYLQDDWKVTPRLTLNLGVRYELDINFYNQTQMANNRTYLALKAIGSPYGKLLHTPAHDFAPRLGFAWDITGNGRNVLRGGYGWFFDQPTNGSIWQPNIMEKPILDQTATYVNTGVGAGQLASYVYGVSPLPAGPPAFTTQITPGVNIAGQLLAPTTVNPYAQVFHLGYSRQVSANMVLSADYTHILGLHQFRPQQINPLEGPAGQPSWDSNAASYNTCGIPAGTNFRRLQCAFGSALGDPKILGSVTLGTSDNRDRYDELIVHFERRSARVTFQASYTLARAYAYGGVVSGTSFGGGTTPMPSANQDNFFGPGEWGPTAVDERHRVVLSGVFNLPGGIQVSPVFQVASARPYTLTAGTDCNKDGVNNDRAFFLNGAPVACNTPGATQVSVNSQRGLPTWDLDARLTKFFNLGNETRRLGFFAEFYNLTNKANFGNLFNGNALSKAFETPIGYLAGLPTSSQLQLGARFSF